MASHPIESLMKTAMESIQQMVDVNTIVGDPVETPEGLVIIPISRVTCGFAAGGSEFPAPEEEKKPDQNNNSSGNGQQSLPFGGGSGAGVSVQPVGFLVVGQGQVRLLPVDGNVIIDRIIDEVPGLLDKVSGLLKKNKDSKENKENKADSEKVIIVSDD